MISKLAFKHIGERKGHSIDSLCLQNSFEMSKNSKKRIAKNTSMAEPSSPKMLLSHS